MNSFNWSLSQEYAFVVLILSVLSCIYSDICVNISCDFLKLFSTYFFITVTKYAPIIIGIITATVRCKFTFLAIWNAAIINVKTILAPWESILYTVDLISFTSFTKYDIISPFLIFCISFCFNFKNLLNKFIFKSLSKPLEIFVSKYFQITLTINKIIHIPIK